MLGVARGLARKHAKYNATKIPHRNIKSSNVLLGKNGVARISNFGLSLLLNSVHAIARLGQYQAPEQSEIKRLSQQANLYRVREKSLSQASRRVEEFGVVVTTGEGASTKWQD